MQCNGSPNIPLSLSPAQKHRGLTLAVAGAGVGAFLLLGLPLPFLFGPMSASLLAALAGLPLKGMGVISVAGRTVLGVAVGASILGPLIVTAALSLAGVIHHRPPSEAILTAQFLIGIGIGVGYVGVTFYELRRDVLAGVVFVLLLAGVAAGFTEIVVFFGLAHPVEGFLSFAPGGQAEMTVLAIVAGGDLGFVVVHHLTRITVVITGAPIAARIFRVRERRREEDET